LRQYLPEPRHYELMTILSPEIPDDEITAHLDQIAGYVASSGGEVLEVNRESPWGRRRLAYAIRHHGRDVRDGYYTVYRFRIAPTGVAEIERDLSLHDLLIRHLITQQDEPAPVEAVEAATGETATSAVESLSEPAAVAAAVIAEEAPAIAPSEADQPDETPVASEAPVEQPVEVTDEPAAAEEAEESQPAEAPTDESTSTDVEDEAEPDVVAEAAPDEASASEAAAEAAPDEAPATESGADADDTEPAADPDDTESAPPSAPQSEPSAKED
jgi:small subunit ribosomal protein S6